MNFGQTLKKHFNTFMLIALAALCTVNTGMMAAPSKKKKKDTLQLMTQGLIVTGVIALFCIKMYYAYRSGKLDITSDPKRSVPEKKGVEKKASVEKIKCPKCHEEKNPLNLHADCKGGACTDCLLHELKNKEHVNIHATQCPKCNKAIDYKYIEKTYPELQDSHPELFFDECPICWERTKILMLHEPDQSGGSHGGACASCLPDLHRQCPICRGAINYAYIQKTYPFLKHSHPQLFNR